MAEEKKRRYTEAQNRATQRYIRENLEEIKFRVRKGEKDRYKTAAEKTGMSMAKFFLTAADEKIAQEVVGNSISPKNAAGRPAGAGSISLPSRVLETALRASEAAGETVPQFVERAVETQVKRDEVSLRMGLNLATGEKLETDVLETKELLSIPRMGEKLMEGKKTPLSECVPESEVD